jgi:hypothetical protein
MQNWLPRKQNINSVEVHPQLNNNGHPMDGALVSAGLLWPRLTNDKQQFHFGAYTELCLIFRMGTKSFRTGPRTGFSQIHLCETGTRARTVLVYFLQTKTQSSS